MWKGRKDVTKNFSKTNERDDDNISTERGLQSWLGIGIGVSFAYRVREPRGPYGRRLRRGRGFSCGDDIFCKLENGLIDVRYPIILTGSADGRSVMSALGSSALNWISAKDSPSHPTERRGGAWPPGSVVSELIWAGSCMILTTFSQLLESAQHRGVWFRLSGVAVWTFSLSKSNPTILTCPDPAAHGSGVMPYLVSVLSGLT